MSARVGIYLDANAGAPLKPKAREALLSLLSGDALVANPSSVHLHGRRSKKLIAEARERIALSLGNATDPEQLVFTSSGTEANQLAIRSALMGGAKPCWITTPVEHDSVLQMRKWVESRGGSISFVALDENGAPSADSLSLLLRPETALVSVVWVNNETGAMTDLARWIATVRSLSPAARIHVDAAQAWGKLPIDLSQLGADYVSFSGHKIGGPAGTGILWLGRGVPLEPLLSGKQEKGRRAGTENVIGLAALGAAASEIEPAAWVKRVAPLRERLENAICERIPGAQVNAKAAQRVANTLSLSFEGLEGEGLVLALDLAGYSVSAGSACSSGVMEPSHVLMAMGRSRAEAMASVRVSLVDELPWEVLEKFIEDLAAVVERLRKAARSKGLTAGSPAQSAFATKETSWK